MRASELVERLKELIEKHGDLDVALVDDGESWESFSIDTVCYDESYDESRDDQFLIS